MIEPTVGRVVWYHHAHEQPPYPKLGDQPFTAIVAFVHSERLVNLSVIAHDGRPYGRENVLLLQDADAPPVAAPYAEWMPFQKEQAAKAEALQATLGQQSAALTTALPATGTAAQGPDTAAQATAAAAAAPVTAQAAPQDGAAPAAPAAQQPAPQPQASAAEQATPVTGAAG